MSAEAGEGFKKRGNVMTSGIADAMKEVFAFRRCVRAMMS
jgi:hypothetical protein